MSNIYIDLYDITELQQNIMKFVDIWVHVEKTPVPRSEIIKSMQLKGVNMPTTRNALYSLLRKGYLRETVTISNKTSYVQLRGIQYRYETGGRKLYPPPIKRISKKMAKSEYKYTDKTVSIAEEYLNSSRQENMELPTVEGLALKLGVDDDTLNEWTKIHKDFKRVFKKLKMMQKVQLINNGMYGGKEINVAMFIFLLKNNHGMKERNDVTTNDKDIPQPLLPNIKTNET